MNRQEERGGSINGGVHAGKDIRLCASPSSGRSSSRGYRHQ